MSWVAGAAEQAAFFVPTDFGAMDRKKPVDSIEYAQV
jgi:hypothetical protein